MDDEKEILRGIPGKSFNLHNTTYTTLDEAQEHFTEIPAYSFIFITGEVNNTDDYNKIFQKTYNAQGQLGFQYITQFVAATPKLVDAEDIVLLNGKDIIIKPTDVSYSNQFNLEEYLKRLLRQLQAI